MSMTTLNQKTIALRRVANAIQDNYIETDNLTITDIQGVVDAEEWIPATLKQEIIADFARGIATRKLLVAAHGLYVTMEELTVRFSDDMPRFVDLPQETINTEVKLFVFGELGRNSNQRCKGIPLFRFSL